MRLTRRTSFAAPFVMVVTAACGGPAKREPIHDNPPQPQDTPEAAIERCKATQRDTACEPDQRCHIADGCGLNGFECRDGKWHEQMTLCNPPPPGSEVAPPAPAPPPATIQ